MGDSDVIIILVLCLCVFAFFIAASVESSISADTTTIVLLWLFCIFSTCSLCFATYELLGKPPTTVYHNYV